MEANYHAFSQLADAAEDALKAMQNQNEMDRETEKLKRMLVQARFALRIAKDKGEWIVSTPRIHKQRGNSYFISLDDRFGCVARIVETDKGTRVLFERTFFYDHDDFEAILSLVLQADRKNRVEM